MKNGEFAIFDHVDRSAQRDELRWQDDALCAQTDPEIFFSEQAGKSNDVAKKICGQCDVGLQCLHNSLTGPQEREVVGGMTYHQRKKLLNKTRAEIDRIFYINQKKNQQL